MRRLPAALKPTLFDLWGDGAFFAMLLVSLVGAFKGTAPVRNKTLSDERG